MAEINVTFINIEGRQLTVSLDGSITGQEAIAELIACGFIPPNQQGAVLVIKGGNNINIDSNQSFRDAGVKEPTSNTLRVIPIMDAGY